MLELIKAFLWEPAAARAAFIALLTFGALYVAQPAGRDWWERGLTAGGLAAGVGAASAPSGRSKSVEAELERMRAEIEALRGSKP